MKCELEFENYRFLTLDSSSQLLHHKGDAFKLFLTAAKSPATCRAKVQGNPQLVNGAILVWGRFTPQGQASVIKDFGIHTVLGVENIIRDLIQWQNKEFEELIYTKESWCQYLFTGLRELNNL
jgi:hypothetical protein